MWISNRVRRMTTAFVALCGFALTCELVIAAGPAASAPRHRTVGSGRVIPRTNPSAKRVVQTAHSFVPPAPEDSQQKRARIQQVAAIEPVSDELVVTPLDAPEVTAHNEAPTPPYFVPESPYAAVEPPVVVDQPFDCELTHSVYGCDLSEDSCDACVPCDEPCETTCDGGCSTGGCPLGFDSSMFLGEDCWYLRPMGEPWRLSDSLAHSTHGALSCDACDSCDGVAEPCVTVGGWVSAGMHERDNGLFNSRPDEINWHQVWLYAERVADGSNGPDFGFRVDVMYGQDADDTQSFGNEPDTFDFGTVDRGAGYGWAIPQAYVEYASGDLSVIAGHFYTLLGYEVVTAPDNFFYSHAYTMYNSEAFTHTGALATYAAGDDLTVYAGWTLGWDTGFDQFVEFGQAGSSFLGGYSVGLGENATFTHIVTAGDFGATGDGFSQSMVLDVSVTDKLNYVIQSDILRRDGQVFDANGDLIGLSGRYETVGVNQYLLYRLADRVGLGTRVEWWKADGKSVGAWTVGANLNPLANVTIRPEVRYQWVPGLNNGVITPVSENQFIFGVDAVVTF